MTGARIETRRKEPGFKPGQFYILAAVAGSVLFSLLAVQLKMEAAGAAGIAIGTTFVFRLLAIQFNWKSSPVWRDPPAPLPPPESKQNPGPSAPAPRIED